MRINTIREAELEFELLQAKKELTRLRHELAHITKDAARAHDIMNGIKPEPKIVALSEFPAPLTFKRFASVDIVKDVLSHDTIVITGRAVGKDNEVCFCNYISGDELLTVRDAAEYLGELHQLAMQQVANVFVKRKVG